MSSQFTLLLCSLLAVSSGIGRAATAAGTNQVSVLKGVSYETPTGPRKMDIYLPARTEQSPAAPCFIWIGKSEPGGRDESVCGDLAGAGFVAARIDYEPNDKPSDQPVMIGKCAVRFLRASASRFGVDEHRIAIGGSSIAGAYALLVGFTPDEPRFAVKDIYPGMSDRVSAVVTLSALTDLRAIYDVKGWSADALEELRALSPLSYVAAGAPAVLIFHGTNDKNLGSNHAIALEKLLAKHQVPHRLVLLDRVGHTYSLTKANGRPLPADVKGICVTFLRTYLAPPK